MSAKNALLFFCISYLIGLFGVYALINFSNVVLSVFLFPLLYLIGIFLFYRVRWWRGKQEVYRLSVLLLSGLLISSLFSYNPVKSLGYVMILHLNIIYSFLLFVFFSKLSLLRFILNTLRFLLMLSIVYLFIDSSFVLYIDPLDRDSLLGLPNFKGFYPHKIHASFYNIIGVFLSWYFYRRRRSNYDLIWAVIFVIAVLSTGSSLGLISLVLLFLFCNALIYLRHNIGYHLTVASLVTFVLCFFVSYLFDAQYLILEILGRDKTLTGRTDIWDFGLNYIERNLLLGGGFAIFFDQVPQAPANTLWKQMLYYEAPSFHNGFIEILAEGGILGALPFFFMLVYVFFSCLKRGNYVFLGLAILCII